MCMGSSQIRSLEKATTVCLQLSMAPSHGKGGVPPFLHGKNHHRTLCNRVLPGSLASGGTGLGAHWLCQAQASCAANSVNSTTSSLDAHGKSGLGSSVHGHVRLGLRFSNESSSYSLTASTSWEVSSSRCTSGLTPILPLRMLRLVFLLGVALRPVCLVTNIDALLDLLRLSVEGCLQERLGADSTRLSTLQRSWPSNSGPRCRCSASALGGHARQRLIFA